MKMDFKNVFNLIRSFVVENYKKELIPLLVIAVVVPILSNFDVSVFVYSLLSVLFAARIFKNLQRPPSAIAYMMLPASTAEKTMANFLLVSVIYPLTCALFALVALGIDVLLFKIHHDYPYPMPQDVGGGLGFFLLLAIFSFASVYYKKHSFWNVCLWGVVMFLFMLIYKRLFCYIFADNNIFSADNIFLADLSMLNEPINDFFDSYPIVSSVVQLLLICFFWGMTYLRLKETEV